MVVPPWLPTFSLPRKDLVAAVVLGSVAPLYRHARCGGRTPKNPMDRRSGGVQKLLLLQCNIMKNKQYYDGRQQFLKTTGG